MFDKDQTIENFDAEVWQAMQQEDQRQEQHIELIASENYTSPAVMAAQGGKMTNKYAEGYPGKSYYCGCEYVDYESYVGRPFMCYTEWKTDVTKRCDKHLREYSEYCEKNKNRKNGKVKSEKKSDKYWNHIFMI